MMQAPDEERAAQSSTVHCHQQASQKGVMWASGHSLRTQELLVCIAHTYRMSHKAVFSSQHIACVTSLLNVVTCLQALVTHLLPLLEDALNDGGQMSHVTLINSLSRGILQPSHEVGVTVFFFRVMLLLRKVCPCHATTTTRTRDESPNSACERSAHASVRIESSVHTWVCTAHCAAKPTSKLKSHHLRLPKKCKIRRMCWKRPCCAYLVTSVHIFQSTICVWHCHQLHPCVVMNVVW